MRTHLSHLVLALAPKPPKKFCYNQALLWTFAQICPGHFHKSAGKLMSCAQWTGLFWPVFFLSLFLPVCYLSNFSMKLSLKLVSTMYPMHVLNLIGFLVCVMDAMPPTLTAHILFSFRRFCWCLFDLWMCDCLIHSLRKLMLTMINVYHEN